MFPPAGSLTPWRGISGELARNAPNYMSRIWTPAAAHVKSICLATRRPCAAQIAVPPPALRRCASSYIAAQGRGAFAVPTNAKLRTAARVASDANAKRGQAEEMTQGPQAADELVDRHTLSQRIALRRLRRLARKGKGQPLSPDDWAALWELNNTASARAVHRLCGCFRRGRVAGCVVRLSPERVVSSCDRWATGLLARTPRFAPHVSSFHRQAG